MPRSVEAFNSNVHSASRADTNSRTVLAEFRYKRFHLSVTFDASEERFEFCRSEHGREIESRTDSETSLLEKFAYASQAILNDAINQRRFQKSRGVDQDWLGGSHPPGIRQFRRADVPRTRPLFNGMKPFDPNAD